ncbi:hypothetical protein Tco_1428595 [Tanacetum coccineum]
MDCLLPSVALRWRAYFLDKPGGMPVVLHPDGQRPVPAPPISRPRLFGTRIRIRSGDGTIMLSVGDRIWFGDEARDHLQAKKSVGADSKMSGINWLMVVPSGSYGVGEKSSECCQPSRYLDEVVPSTNRQNMSGKGRKLPGGGSTSRRRGPQAFPDAISREELDRILRQKDQEAELLRKQTAEAQQRAYWLIEGCDAAYSKFSETMYGAISEYFY